MFKQAMFWIGGQKRRIKKRHSLEYSGCVSTSVEEIYRPDRVEGTLIKWINACPVLYRADAGPHYEGSKEGWLSDTPVPVCPGGNSSIVYDHVRT